MDNLEKLKLAGLAGAYSASTVENPIDRNSSRHRILRDIFIDYEAVGSLTNAEPRMVLRLKEGSFTTNNSFGEVQSSWKMPLAENQYYVAKYKLTQKLYKNLSFIHMPIMYRSTQSNNFFKEFESVIDNYVERPYPNNYNKLPFARISYPSGNANTNNVYINRPVSGSYPLVSGDQLSIVDFNPENLSGFLEEFFITGSGANRAAFRNRFNKSLKQKNYLVWKPNFTEGLGAHHFQDGYDSSSGFHGFHIPYPSTVDSQRLYRYNFDTKLTTRDNYFNKRFYAQNSLLVVSTGNAENGFSKICYVSPHIIVPTTVNTVDNYYTKVKKSITTGDVVTLINTYKKTNNVFQVNALVLQSSNLSGFGNGLYIKNYEYDATYIDFSTKLYTGGPYTYKTDTFTGSTYAVWGDQHIKQDEPLNSTPFYKFYTGLYTYNKGINEGTWDGIIPSGTFATVEVISPIFEDTIGLSDDLYLVYSGIGTLDPIDTQIRTGITVNAFKQVDPLIKVEGNGEVSYTSYVTGPNKYQAITQSIEAAKLGLFKKWNRLVKNTLPDSFVKTRRFIKSQDFINNKKSTKNINPVETLPESYYITSGVA